MSDNINQNQQAGAAAPQRGFSPEGKRSFIRLMVFFGVIFLAVIVIQMRQIYSEQAQLIGDGQNVETYGYDLSSFLGERDLLVASGRAKDAMPVLGELDVVSPEDFEDAVPLPGAGPLDRPGPKAITAGVVDMYKDKPFQRPVVDSDRVLGVTINGETRAYPIRYLQGHEIINDTLGGEPIAVTFSVLCDSAVVFDREIGGETLEFGFSGLIYNSNLLMYDRRPDPAPATSPATGPATGSEGETASAGDMGGSKESGAADAPDQSSEGESLWSQLGMKAISGPAAEAGRTLDVLPMWHGTFEAWRERHPETTVFIGDPEFEDRYERQDLMQRYFNKGEIVFPVSAKPATGGPLETMTPVEAYRTEGGDWRVLPTERVEAGSIPTDVPRIHARWFGWYAFHGDAGLERAEDAGNGSGGADSPASSAE